MKRLVIRKFGKLPELVEAEIPKPGSSQYLVRMKYAPINPADLGFLFGKYGIVRDLPTGIGFEGSGVIEEAENPLMKGKKVSVLVPSVFKDGTYSTHLKIPKQYVSVWPEESDDRQMANSMINPLTVLGFKRIIEKSKYRNVLLSASNSQLSRMVIKHLSKNKEVEVYGMLREKEKQNVNGLVDLGARGVFIDQQVHESVSKMKKVLFLDAVGGEPAAKVFRSLPHGSKMVVYGNLSKESDISIPGKDLLFQNKSVQGYWLNTLLDNIPNQQFQEMKEQIIKSKEDFTTSIAKQYALGDFQTAFREALKPGTNGKILLKL